MEVGFTFHQYAFVLCDGGEVRATVSGIDKMDADEASNVVFNGLGQRRTVFQHHAGRGVSRGEMTDGKVAVPRLQSDGGRVG